jgi:hypothetical protein
LKDPEATTFAEQVIRDQGREIAETKDWLKKYVEREGRRWSGNGFAPTGQYMALLPA